MNFILIPGTFPSGTKWPNLPQEFMELLSQYMVVDTNGQGSYFNFGSTTPIVDNQDKPWLRLDVNGAPMGWWMFYNGAWTPVTEYKLGDVIFIKDTQAIASPWAESDGSTVNGFVTPNVTPPVGGLKAKCYVGYY